MTTAPRAFAILHEQFENEPLLIHAHPGAHYLFVENVEEGLSGEVGDEESARLALSAERASTQSSIFIAAERYAEVFHLNNFGARLTAHDLDSVLVTQVIRAFHSVVSVVIPVVARVFQSRVDAALRGVGMASDGVDLRYDGHVGAVLTRGESGPHSGKAGTYDENVMGVHSNLPLDL